ncbi:hypothetical protein B566_EDAN006732 [Ephemera danica]|nr:hypothetical protein B566_EDAN006732 [Ephemera danica]
MLQHCEQLICELQQKLLRESERVAVATQVDARKDDYLGRLRERYDSAARHWHAERERLLLDVAEKNEMCSATIQRLRGCERELSKALDLASGFQQRSLELERDKTETEAKLQARVLSLERQCSLLEQEIMKHQAAASITEQHENKRGDQLAALQNLVEDEREERRKLEAENKRLLREAEEKEAAALTLEAERDAQQAKLRDTKQRCDVLEQQKNALQQSLEELKKKEKSARQEVRELSQAMEQSRQSLKEQYQAQLDQVVRAKLAEFQAQLDTAETALRQQWENRETEARNKHTRALNIAWWQRSLSQAMAQIQELTSELERQEKHREQLAGKIRSMLQAQYQQAATLIWEPPTDGTNGSAKANGGEFKGWGSLPSVNQCGMGRSQTQPATSASENQLSEAGTGTKTVLSSYAQAELKKYIEMLLQRPAGDPLHFEGQSQGTSSKTSYIPELDLSKLSINLPEKSKTSKDNQKPPWK